MIALATHGYYGRAECGCIVLLIADCPATKKDTAREIAKAVRGGLTIERGLIEDVRKLPFGHKCGQPSAVRAARSR
jgi:CTP:molybdopterin cytidylyltransferase MocA